MPVSLSTIAAIDFSAQLVMFAYSAFHQTEVFYDVTGSLTYLLCISTLVVSNQPLNTRQMFVAAGVCLWAMRLGFFLYKRVLVHADHRFDIIKKSPLRFLGAWLIQGLWIFITASPAFVALASVSHSPWSLLDYIGTFIWMAGFALESLADYQKSAFKALYPKDFCNTGVWRYSRYPNYFGEIALWTGMTLLCFGEMQGTAYFALLSPVFVTLLIVNVSGVRLSEISQKKQYGSRKDWIEYVRATSKYFPLPPLKKTD